MFQFKLKNGFWLKNGLGERVGIGRPLRKEASVDTQWSGQETVLDLGSHQAEVSG